MSDKTRPDHDLSDLSQPKLRVAEPPRPPTRPSSPNPAPYQAQPASPAPFVPPGPATTPYAAQQQQAQSGTYVVRSRAYTFVLDQNGQPIELGSGRYAKAYLGEERWLESKSSYRRPVAIKILQKGVTEADALRFQIEKQLLERVQGHPNIVTLYASAESENPGFIPPVLRERVENDFMVLELADMSLEDRLSGARGGAREDLLAFSMRERVFRVLEYMVPIASAIEHAHLVCNIVHRDLKPGNVLLKLPRPELAGSVLRPMVADFNVGKLHEESVDLSMTAHAGVPGTLYFQSPEQETNNFELLVNVTQGSAEVDYYADFFMSVTQNDTFQIFNRPERYAIIGADRARRKIYLATPFAQPSEQRVRSKITKLVDRPADIYSLGAMLYYLITGACGNPKVLFETFVKFIEYDKQEKENTIEAYLTHEYETIQAMLHPKPNTDSRPADPADRFFSYKHYLDGNGELIDISVMRIIVKAMIRNKPDSYCQSWDAHTPGAHHFVTDLINLYAHYGVDVMSRSAVIGRFAGGTPARPLRPSGLWKRMFGGKDGPPGQR